ncbi:MAG: DUF177 domain-containing protein, partial [Pseudomonadota bacterium]
MIAVEFSRMIKVRPLPADPIVIEASEVERSALAARFALTSVDSLRAEVSLEAEKNAIRATGSLQAAIVQICAVSGEDFPVAIAEPVDLRFVEESTLPTSQTEDGEIEIDLSAGDGDEIEYSGDKF